MKPQAAYRMAPVTMTLSYPTQISRSQYFPKSNVKSGAR